MFVNVCVVVLEFVVLEAVVAIRATTRYSRGVKLVGNVDTKFSLGVE